MNDRCKHRIESPTGNCYGEVEGTCSCSQHACKEIFDEPKIVFNGQEQKDSLKFDNGKLRLDLIPPEVIEELGKVLTYGLSKGYKESSWQDVSKDRYEAALLRHYVAWKKGELLDKESSLRHMSHLLVNAAFLLWGEIHGK